MNLFFTYQKTSQMNKKPIFLLTILGMVLFSVNLVAQELWSLEKCVTYAFDNNLTIKQSKLDVMNAEHDLLQSKLNMVPSLNSSAGLNFGWGRSPDPATNIYLTQQTQNTFFGINSEVTLFQGLQQINYVRQLQFDYLARKYDSDKIKNDMSLFIAASYLSILFNLELLDNAQRLLDVTQAQVERTSKQVEAGTLPKGNLYDLEAQAAADEANLVTAKNSLMLAYLDLMQLLDLEASSDFDIEKPQLEITKTPSLLPVDMIYNKAIEIMPEIKSADYQVQSADRLLAQAKGYNSPRIFAQGNFGTNISNQIRQDPLDPDSPTIPFDDQFKDNRNGTLFFGLAIPIFNGYQVTTNMRKARVLKESAQINLQDQKNQLRKNVETAYADALAAYQTYVSRNKAVEALYESFKYTDEKFNVGMVNGTDYNVAKIQLSSAESDLVAAKYDYIFKVKILDFYLGRTFTLDDIATENQE
jgi:outer membrane protein